ncbi:MAG TPA: BON domain-containing protein, partial [Leucothrix mucor]|nr:BON domain-containing protein [Leucothrix mucor]
MGLFDFAKGIGNKIFGSKDDDEKASEKLTKHIEEDNPGISNLQVTVEDGIASIKGEAESPTAFEKAILMAGNALGIAEVQAE